jgi:hypothetical protein
VIVPCDPHQPITGAMWTLLRWDYPDAYLQRLDVAMRLALDVDACTDLLCGTPVDPARIDTIALVRAQEESLVQLVAPIELLEKAA